MKTAEILHALDNSNDGAYHHFISLGHGYSYLLDVRMNLYRNEKGDWAIAIERLGENPRAGGIVLEIYYYGNCLFNLDIVNNRTTNVSYLYPADREVYLSTFDENQLFKRGSEYWLVRGGKISVKYATDAFARAGVVPNEFNKGKITAEEIARVVVFNNASVFRATDAELRKSIPESVNKIMVIDEWYHKDFVLMLPPPMNDDALRYTFEFNKNLTGMNGMSFEQFAAQFQQQMMANDDWNSNQWEHNRPSSYETWQQIAALLETGDTTLYNPTLQANTHWKHWPDSGGL